jgi:hypothetical protein
MGPSTIKPAIYSHTSTFLCCFACFLFPDCRNLLLFEVKKKNYLIFEILMYIADLEMVFWLHSQEILENGK